MIKKILTGGAILSALITGSALAADMAVKAPMYAPAPAYSWTGFYVGAHVGGSWGTTDAALDPGLFGPFSIPLGSGTTNGLLGGGQIGYNYQVGGFVLGVQGDIAAIDNKGSVHPIFFFGPASLASAKSNWLATVTGRVGGVVLDKILVYVKGGGAWLNRDYSLTDPGFPISVSQNNTRFGWTLGLGTEYAFNRNWTGFVEYDYLDFGNKSIAFTNPFVAPVPVTIGDRLHVVKAGVNYKFF